MKKIINGKKYDTETAKEIGEWFNGETGLTMIVETLYQKRTGEFFLLGNGGPRTQYARYEGNNTWTGDVVILPLTYDKARDWAERYLEVDVYESVFGEVAEDDSKSQICINITNNVLAIVRRKAVEEGVSISKFFEEAAKASITDITNYTTK